MNTPTPRTNRAWNILGDDNAEAAWSFARTLERELAAEREKSERYRLAMLKLDAELATERAMSKQYRECWCNQCGKIITAMKEETK